MLHPVPPVPELRTKVAKRIDRWRVGPGKHPVAVFVTALILSVFVQSIGWMYFLNVFCMSGDDRGCTGKLDWSIWFLATALLYVNAWSIASWIADATERRRLRRLEPTFAARIAALDPNHLRRRENVSQELRRRALDRESEQPRAFFQAKLLGWFRNLFIAASAIPLITVIDVIDEVSAGLVTSGIILVQLWILYKITKHVRRMRRIARELAEQWESDFASLERDVTAQAPVGAERVTFRPWSPRARAV